MISISATRLTSATPGQSVAIPEATQRHYTSSCIKQCARTQASTELSHRYYTTVPERRPVSIEPSHCLDVCCQPVYKQPRPQGRVSLFFVLAWFQPIVKQLLRWQSLQSRIRISHPLGGLEKSKRHLESSSPVYALKVREMRSVRLNVANPSGKHL